MSTTRLRPRYDEALVFKGGTALSKVFGVIRRFSEDIDLSVSPATLGIEEAKVEQVQEVFLDEPPSFEWIRETLRGLEDRINQSR